MYREFLPAYISIIFLAGLMITGITYGITQTMEEPAQVEGEIDVEIDMVADDWYFEPNEITVQEGDQVRLNIESRNTETGEYDHGIHIPGLGVDEYLPAGETAQVEFVADETGEHRFYCNVFCGEDHDDMTGTITVEENGEHTHGHEHEETHSQEINTDVEEISRHPSNMPNNPNYKLYANGSYETTNLVKKEKKGQ